jgi:hypothetical protein
MLVHLTPLMFFLVLSIPPSMMPLRFVRDAGTYKAGANWVRQANVLFPVRRMLVRPYKRRLIAFLGGDAPPARNELARYPWFRSLLILRMLLGNAFALCIAATETNPGVSWRS